MTWRDHIGNGSSTWIFLNKNAAVRGPGGQAIYFFLVCVVLEVCEVFVVFKIFQVFILVLAPRPVRFGQRHDGGRLRLAHANSPQRENEQKLPGLHKTTKR
jgi:hypothetical protein